MFRPREKERYKLRKHRKNDLDSFRKLQQVKKDFEKVSQPHPCVEKKITAAAAAASRFGAAGAVLPSLVLLPLVVVGRSPWPWPRAWWLVNKGIVVRSSNLVPGTGQIFHVSCCFDINLPWPSCLEAAPSCAVPLFSSLAARSRAVVPFYSPARGTTRAKNTSFQAATTHNSRPPRLL